MLIDPRDKQMIEYILSNGGTRAFIAKELGVTWRSVQNWYKGRHSMTQDNRYKMSQLCDKARLWPHKMGKPSVKELDENDPFA